MTINETPFIYALKRIMKLLYFKYGMRSNDILRNLCILTK